MEITVQKHSLRLDTKRYTLEDIHKEVMEDFALLVSLGYEDLLNKEVKVSWGKKVRAYGTCKRIGRQPNGKMLYEIQKAVKLYSEKEQWNRLVENAMSADFSWKNSALQYIRMYNTL